LCVCGVRLAFSRLLFWRISFCFHSLTNCQAVWNEAFSIASRPNTCCVGISHEVLCAVEFTAFWHAANTPWNPKNESRHVLTLICALGIMLWSVLWDHFTMEFDWGFQLAMILRSNELAFNAMFRFNAHCTICAGCALQIMFVERLVTSIHCQIWLWVSVGNNFAHNAMFSFKSFAYFCSKLCPSVHSNFCRSGMSREPVDF